MLRGKWRFDVDQNPRYVQRNSKASPSGTLFIVFVPLRANDLNLHVGEQRRQRPQSSQHRGYQRHHATHRNPSRKRNLQEHLVVLVADDQATNISLINELLGALDELAGGYLYLLGNGVLFLLAFVKDPVGFATHRSSPLLVPFNPTL